jgi:hypothetical protein
MGSHQDESPLVLSDESTSGPFVTGGAIHLPAAAINEAAEALHAIKQKWRVPPESKIHCRVLFAGGARQKSPFNALSLDDCQSVLFECVEAMNRISATWWGGWVDRERYPTELRLVECEQFAVSNKHLAGLAVVTALKAMEHHVGSHYRFAFDPDPTKIDWGLASRLQATHFARTHPQAIDLDDVARLLLDMADITAYTIAQSLLVDHAPPNLKPWQLEFPKLLKLMQMRAARFAYTPWLRPLAAK